MSYQNIFKRYEIKYLITREQKEAIKQLMSGNMETLSRLRTGVSICPQ